MSPILKKYITIATLFLCVCTFWNCGNQSTDSGIYQINLLFDEAKINAEAELGIKIGVKLSLP